MPKGKAEELFCTNSRSEVDKMSPSKKDETEDASWRETFNRQWESMKSIDEWLDVYIWEIDKETIHFANKKARIILRLAWRVFDDHSKEISKFVYADENHVRVEDVINWTNRQTGG